MKPPIRLPPTIRYHSDRATNWRCPCCTVQYRAVHSEHCGLWLHCVACYYLPVFDFLMALAEGVSRTTPADPIVDQGQVCLVSLYSGHGVGCTLVHSWPGMCSVHSSALVFSLRFTSALVCSLKLLNFFKILVSISNFFCCANLKCGSHTNQSIYRQCLHTVWSINRRRSDCRPALGLATILTLTLSGSKAR